MIPSWLSDECSGWFEHLTLMAASRAFIVAMVLAAACTPADGVDGGGGTTVGGNLGIGGGTFIGNGGAQSSSVGGGVPDGGHGTGNVGGGGPSTGGAPGAGTGGAGGAAEPVCASGETQDCYTGPVGTQGVGVCHAGTEVCLPDGTGWDTCVGEAVPTVEDCATTMVDEDCDGLTPPCPCDAATYVGGVCDTGQPGWCADGHQVCLAGFITCVGTSPWIETCGNGVDESCTGTPDGACAGWQVNVAGTTAVAVAADGAGHIYVTGNFSAPSIDFGGGVVLTNSGTENAFLAKYDIAGTCLWAKRIGDVGASTAIDLDVKGDHVVLVGHATTDLIIEGSSMPLVSGPYFLATYNNAGTLGWAVGVPGYRDVSIDVSGNIYLLTDSINLSRYTNSGAFDWKLSGGVQLELTQKGNFYVIAATLDGGVMGIGKGQSSFEGKQWIAKFSSTASMEWVHYATVASTSNEWSIRDVALDAVGNPIVVGQADPRRGRMIAYDAAGNRTWTLVYTGGYSQDGGFNSDIDSARILESRLAVYAWLGVGDQKPVFDLGGVRAWRDQNTSGEYTLAYTLAGRAVWGVRTPSTGLTAWPSEKVLVTSGASAMLRAYPAAPIANPACPPVCDPCGVGGACGPGHTCQDELCIPNGILTGDYTISSAANISALTGTHRITGNVTLNTITDIAVSGLRSVDGTISINTPVVNFSGLALETAGGFNVNATSVVSLSAPSLVQVGGAIALGAGVSPTLGLPALTSMGGGLIATGTLVTSIDLPSLQYVERIRINGNASLEKLSLPALTKVGYPDFFTFQVTNNPKLPSCQVQQIIDNLVANGFSGTVQNTGNDDAAVCP